MIQSEEQLRRTLFALGVGQVVAVVMYWTVGVRLTVPQRYLSYVRGKPAERL